MFDNGVSPTPGSPEFPAHGATHARPGRTGRRLWLPITAAVVAVAVTVAVWALVAAGAGDGDDVRGAPATAATPASPPTSPVAGQTPAASLAPITAATESVTSVPAPERVIDSSMTLELPTLGTTAPVIEVGVTEELVLEVPSDPGVLGRWSDGARVGDGTGTVALVGHVTYRGELGVLHRLPNLRPGDEAVVTTPNGPVRYVTERVDVYNKQALPYQDIFQFDVPERLVLITCGGEFDRSTGHYDSNVVAYLTPA